MKKDFDVESFIDKIKNHCKLGEIKSFEAEEVITTFLIRRNQLCILLDGDAQLITYDKDGNKKILYFYRKNDIFGEALFKLYYNKELFVLAKRKSQVLFLSYDTIEHCNMDCSFHIDLLRNLPDLILNGIAEQNLRILLLSNKSVRDKLITYFSNLSREHSNKTFELPFTLTELADYLMIERTAMMRELKRLKDEKIIKKTNNKITLCK